MKPAIDYYEIFDGLLKRGAQVDLIDRTSVMGSRDPRVRLALRTAEPSAPVALAAFLRRKSSDAVFAIGESVSILLALLLKGTRSCPGFVTIGHRLTAPKKKILSGLAGATPGAAGTRPPDLGFLMRTPWRASRPSWRAWPWESL